MNIKTWKQRLIDGGDSVKYNYKDEQVQEAMKLEIEELRLAIKKLSNRENKENENKSNCSYAKESITALSAMYSTNTGSEIQQPILFSVTKNNALVCTTENMLLAMQAFLNRIEKCRCPYIFP